MFCFEKGYKHNNYKSYKNNAQNPCIILHYKLVICFALYMRAQGDFHLFLPPYPNLTSKLISSDKLKNSKKSFVGFGLQALWLQGKYTNIDHNTNNYGSDFKGKQKI